MSLHLMSVGVGAVITLGNMGVSYSQTPSANQPQKDEPTVSATPLKIGDIVRTLELGDQNIPKFLAAQTLQSPTLAKPAAIATPTQMPQFSNLAKTLELGQSSRVRVQMSPQRLSQSSDKPQPPEVSQTVPTEAVRVSEMPKIGAVAAAFEQKKSSPVIAQASKPAAQAPKPNAPQQTTPLPPTTPPTSSPQPTAPSPTAPAPTPPTSAPNPVPSAPTPGRLAPAPNYLNPLPNPLQFPTKPEEVRLQGTQPITLAQALELAERNNRDLQISILQLERNRSGLREAQAANFPTVGLQADLSRAQSASSELSRKVQGQRINSEFQTGSNSDAVSTTLTGGLQLNYDIFTSGQRSARIRAAERQARVSELEVERTREQLRLDVTGDYYDLQEADEQVRINQAAVRNAEISLRDTQAQERAGLGTRFDVLRSQVNLANFQQQLTSAIANQNVRRRQLAQRLSLAEAVSVSAADPVVPAGTWTLPIEDSIVLAYKNRAELEQQLVQREISEQQRRAALATLGPTLSVSAQYNLLDVFEQPVRTTDGYSFALQARWNFFDGGAAAARAAQQQKDKEIAETRFVQGRNTVRFQVEQAFATLQSNRANITTTSVAVDQAREALRLARLRFQAGVGTQTDVINAETDLTRTEGSQVSAIIGYNRSLAQLQRAVSNITRQ